MCIAIVAPKGHKIPDDVLVKCERSNRDGGGFAYINDKGKVEIRKGFFNLEDFKKAYDEKYKKFGVNNPMLVHFRIATQGVVAPTNCHPHKIVDGALIHNGHFGWARGTRESPMSDTREFVSAVTNNLKYEDAKECVKEIENSIGWSNKVATLHDCGEFLIFNKDRWTEREGIWYSHSGPLPYEQRK